jgi:hypothetical protein
VLQKVKHAYRTNRMGVNRRQWIDRTNMSTLDEYTHEKAQANCVSGSEVIPVVQEWLYR